MSDKHGLSIGLRRHGSDYLLYLKAQGTLTHADYEVINPFLDSALQEVRQPRVRVLIDGTELEGWELRAAWDDLRLGLKHGNRFERIAIVGNKPWQDKLSTVAGWFTAGDVEYFEDEGQALAWLAS